jgi:enterochelin esterase-like enzyme
MRGRPRILLALAGLAALSLFVATPWLRGWLGWPRAPTPGSVLGAAIADVETGRLTTPLIREVPGSGETEVTFLAQAADGVPPRIVSDATGWGEQPGDGFSFEVGRMAAVARADSRGRPSHWYFLRTRVARGARIEYLVAYAVGDYRVDPHNPRRAQFRGGDPASEFVTPGYVAPPEERLSTRVPVGQAMETTVESRALSGTVPVVVYTPPGYGEDGHYPVAVFHDRVHWGREGAGPRLLDRLIADGTIEAVVAVFADSGRPGDENVPAVRAFLDEELPRWVRLRYSVTEQAGKRAILGVSYGAKDALEAATGAGAPYGRVGLLIPGRRLQPHDIEALAARSAGRLQLAVLAGRYDAPNLETARRVRQAFAAAGHSVRYVEVPEGHNPAAWRTHAGEILAILFPPQ